MTYKNSGVNIDSGNELVTAIKSTVSSTKRSGATPALGGFGAIFDMRAAGYIDPILVAGTDGVGTKLLIASKLGQHNTIGIDLVAMCANDLVVMGAEPLFFLDYFATGLLDIAAAKTILEGVAEGCRLAGCALIGGETAEMPGMYASQEYDLAGFCVGAVERDQILTGDQVREGDIIFGLASSGLHSNGFSLVRRVINHVGIEYDSGAPFQTQSTLGQTLLTPTRMYVGSCLSAIRAGGVHALAHITGGGLLENIPRVLPEGLSAQIDANTWTAPDIFKWIAGAGNITGQEMLRTFNCGIGMVVIVGDEDSNDLRIILEEAGETVFEIGQITLGESDITVSINKPESLWEK